MLNETRPSNPTQLREYLKENPSVTSENLAAYLKNPDSEVFDLTPQAVKDICFFMAEACDEIIEDLSRVHQIAGGDVEWLLALKTSYEQLSRQVDEEIPAPADVLGVNALDDKFWQEPGAKITTVEELEAYLGRYPEETPEGLEEKLAKITGNGDVVAYQEIRNTAASMIEVVRTLASQEKDGQTLQQLSQLIKDYGAMEIEVEPFLV